MITISFLTVSEGIEVRHMFAIVSFAIFQHFELKGWVDYLKKYIIEIISFKFKESLNSEYSNV